MVHLLIALAVIITLYYLFIKGYLFRLILAAFGIFGMYWFLANYVSGTNSTLLTISNFNISWAIGIPFLFLVTVLATTKVISNEV